MRFYEDKVDKEIRFYKGYRIIIIGKGYPRAYVEVPANNKAFYYNQMNEDAIQVHGGITYSDYYYPDCKPSFRNKKEWYIGWDYAHSGDALAISLTPRHGKCWTLDEIMDECRSVINQLKEWEE